MPRAAPVPFKHEQAIDEAQQQEQDLIDNWDGSESLVPTPILLRMQVFVGHYLTTMNAAEAARRSGFSHKDAARQGHALLRNPKVIKLLHEQQKSLLAKIEVTQERVWREIALIAFLDPADIFDKLGELKPVPDIPEDVRRCIAGYKVKKTTFGEDGSSDERELKFANKDAALDKLMRLTGLVKQDEKAKEDLADAIVDGIMRARNRVLEDRHASEGA